MAENSLQNITEIKPDEAAIQMAELLDIELPVEPGFDWTALLSMLGWILALVVVLMLLLYLLRYSNLAQKGLLSAPILLRWQLRKIQKKLAEKAQENVTEKQLFEFYQWAQQLSKTMYKAYQPEQEALFLQLEMFVAQTEEMAFSGKSVDSQSYAQTLQQGQQLLTQYLSWPMLYRCLLANLKVHLSKGVTR